ncbi:hypothetical protein RV18_GL000917 [Enterococcus termitis]|nr:hypothetical protein RV18_GL000917 [Enterococcus termitis]
MLLMNKKKKIWLCFLACFFTIIVAPNVTLAEEAPSALPIQILGINDFHGALSDAAFLSSNLNQETELFKEKQPHGSSIRVQAGDMVGSSPVNSSLLQDEPTIKAMNRMLFEYGTLGNHEFDEGLDEFNRIITGTAPETGIFNSETEHYPREASTQQILIANVRQKADQSIPHNWKPYAVKEMIVEQQKVSIGFIGIVTKTIPNLVSKKYYDAYSFLDEAETIATYSHELQSLGVNAIVVLAHTGNGEAIMDQLNRIAPDHSVDVFIDGHSHKNINTVRGKTRIVQSLSSGQAFSAITGVIDPQTNDFSSTPQANVKLVNKSFPKDLTVEAITIDADQRIDGLASQTISYAASRSTISKKDNQWKESALGNLVADAQVAIASKEGFSVDGALINSGSLRADLAVGSDKSISYGAAHRVQPFGNSLYVVQLSGKQLTEILNKQYQNNQKNPLQIGGISYQYTNYYGTNQPYILTKLMRKNKTNIAANQTVTVVVNEYVYTSAVFAPIFNQGKLLDSLQANDTDAFIQYLKDQKDAKLPINAKIDKRKNYTPFKPATDFSYRTHVQDYGWQSYVTTGKSSGTTGKSKRLEAIQIKLNSSIAGSIQYKTHILDYGWQSWRENNALSGTTGKSKRLEAIQIRLSGALSSYYDIHYRVHSQDYGWLGWAKNEQSSGTQGFSKRLEAIQIKIVPKNTALPVKNRTPFIKK